MIIRLFRNFIPFGILLTIQTLLQLPLHSFQTTNSFNSTQLNSCFVFRNYNSQTHQHQIHFPVDLIKFMDIHSLIMLYSFLTLSLIKILILKILGVIKSKQALLCSGLPYIGVQKWLQTQQKTL